MDTVPSPKRRLSKLKKFAVGWFFGALLALIIAEVALRLWPGLLSGGLADQVYSNYRATPGGIYAVVADIPLRFCWPNYSTSMFSHGYRWKHETDARGFRNPAGADSQVLLLGDSQVYGHGVEESETAAALLRRQYGWGTYNMGRQGDCLFDSYVLTRLYIDELSPKKVVLVVFYNDFPDILEYRRGVEGKPELSWDYTAFRAKKDDPALWSYQGSQLERLRVFRLMKGLNLAWRHRLPPSPPMNPPQPGSGHQVLDQERFATAAAYYQEMLPHLAEACRKAGAKPYVVYLTWGLPETARFDAQAAKFVGDVCAQNNIVFADTGSLLSQSLLLPGDWHMSPRGHAVFAEWLDAFLRRN